MNILDQLDDQRHRLEHWLARATRTTQPRLDRLARDTSDLARHTAAQLEHDALRPTLAAAAEAADQLRHVATDLAQIGREQGGVLARMALKRGRRVGRALRADPAPLMVGALAVVLAASLYATYKSRR